MTDFKMPAEVLRSLLGSGNVIEDCPMAKYTSFKCGGNAALFAVCESEEALGKTLSLIEEKNLPFLFIGNGSNMLFTDAGFPGLVVKLGEAFEAVSVSGTCITAGAGALLSVISRAAAAEGLTGLEFASGIPGSLGGAVFMNAGAYGGEMKHVLVSVRAMDRKGRVFEIPAEDLDLSYRHSCFEENGMVILSAKLRLEKGDKAAIDAKIKELTLQRTTKQPVAYPSAGSFFKRPEGYFAGKLVQNAGLKGLSVGGAQVSALHAGFVINKGGATATDVIDLMKIVQETVMDKFGVLLEPEVRIIGKY